MFRHCRHLIWNHEDRCSQRTRVALAIVFTALAIAAPRAHGQRRSMAMQRGMMMRFPPNTMFSVTMPSGFSNPRLVNGQTRPFPVNPTMFSATVPPRSSNPVMAGQPTPFAPSMAFGFNPFTRFGNFNQLASPFGFNANPYASLYGNAYGMAGYGGGGYGGGGYGGGGNSGGGGNGAGSSYGSPYMSSYGGTDPSYAPDQQAVNDQQGELSQGTNRRKFYDECLYKREKTPTTEEDRQKLQREQLQRSLNNPPATEIRSGQALNVLLMDLGQLAATGDLANGESFPLPLDVQGQKHINVTRGLGNIDLKNDGRLTCPLALSGREYKEVRERLAEQALNAARQVAQSGQVEAATLEKMQADVDQLHQQLRKEGKELPISEYIAAKTFLNQFEAAIKAIQQPDSGSHFSGKYALKAKTVPELVKQMTEQGLQFAPAMPEDEAAYAALHSALAAYYRAARAHSLGR